MTNIGRTEQKYKNPNPLAIAGGVIAGSAVSTGLPLSKQIATSKLSKSMVKLSENLSADEFKTVQKAFIDSIEKSGLKDRGVSILKATAENADEIKQIFNKEMNKSAIKFYPKIIKDLLSLLVLSQIQEGKNACYTFADKKIIMPENQLSLAFFHEAGHAANANLSKIGKLLQKSRAFALLALPISLIAMFKTKKAEGEQPKNRIDKTTDFIKNNAGKLTFAAFLPTILEEGLASIKGQKFAKQFLTPELAKKVAKTNAIGFTSYISAGIMGSLGIFLGVKIKDAIAHRKPIEANK